MSLNAEFVETPWGRMLCTVRRPDGGAPASALLVVPAFGDEMNKSRRMITETGRRLSEHGIALVNPDLPGTGDSDGGFADARWEHWLESLKLAKDWAADRGLEVRGLIAVRTGALLAAELARAAADTALELSVLWQPVASGYGFLNQYLRQRVMQEAFSGDSGVTVPDLLNRIRTGETVQAAGYPLAPALALPMAELRLDAVAGDLPREVTVVDVSRRSDALEPEGATVELGSRSARRYVHPGEPYWTATETVVNHAVVDTTVSVVGETLGPRT